jgi:hypothetical protein
MLLQGLVQGHSAQSLQEAIYCQSNERLVVTFGAYNAC